MYISKFQYTTFKEAVISVEKYFDKILKEIVVFVDIHTQKDFRNENSFYDKLNSVVSKYNIVFLYSGFVKEAYIYEGGLASDIKIVLYASYHNTFKTILNIYNNEKAKEEFINDLKLILKHELVHRVQAIKSEMKILDKPIDMGEELKYYSNSQEIMTHAYQCVEECRLKSYHDNQILSILKQRKSLENISAIFVKYRSLFDNDMYQPIFNKFKKYVYLYLTDPKEINIL